MPRKGQSWSCAQTPGRCAGCGVDGLCHEVFQPAVTERFLRSDGINQGRRVVKPKQTLTQFCGSCLILYFSV